MTTELKWTIGKEVVKESALDKPPYRAYFYWLTDGTLEKAADFDRTELIAEITRLRGLGETATAFKAALKRL